jgi:hypothetical protein
MTPFSFGSDPEFMLTKLEADGTLRYVSAIGKVPGTKDDMLPLGNGHFAFHDNVLAECCPHYGKTKEEVLANFRDCFERYAKVVHPFVLRPQASNTYPAEECLHPAALEFGCDPEMNAYDMATVNAPKCEPGNTFRSGGGHIHLGFIKGNPYPLTDFMGRWWLTRLMDCFIGVPSILMDNDPTSQARRKLYGGAGNMRPKDYGIEYRTLSNFWLASPRTVSLIHDLCGWLITFMQKDELHQEIWETHADAVRAAINNGDREAATKLWESLSQHVEPAIVAEVQAVSKLPPQNFYESWGIKVNAAKAA